MMAVILQLDAKDYKDFKRCVYETTTGVLVKNEDRTLLPINVNDLLQNQNLIICMDAEKV